jgi:hypothetical protein
LDEAVELLARSPYGPRVRAGDTLPAAERGVAATLLWNLRVLAGWLPVRGAGMMRALVAWFEIANVEEHRRALDGRPAAAPFELGSLATAWPVLAATGSADELRAALAASPWGDPGGIGPRDIQLTMRLAWAERVMARVPPARGWALGASALVVARELLGRGQSLPDRAAAIARALLGPRLDATSLPALRRSITAEARWALDGLDDAADLWLGEARWWQRVRVEAARRLARSMFGPDRVIAVALLLAADAWLVCGALETAARGRGNEAFDALV